MLNHLKTSPIIWYLISCTSGKKYHIILDKISMIFKKKEESPKCKRETKSAQSGLHRQRVIGKTPIWIIPAVQNNSVALSRWIGGKLQSATDAMSQYFCMFHVILHTCFGTLKQGPWKYCSICSCVSENMILPMIRE